MSGLAKLVAKIAWGRANANPKVRSWSPLIGAAILVAWVGADLLGHHDAATTIREVGAVTDTVAQSPVSEAEVRNVGEQLVVLVTALIGLWTVTRGLLRKLTAKAHKALAASKGA